MLICTNAEGSRIAAGIQTRITRPIGKIGYRLGSVHPVQRGAYTTPICHVRMVAVPTVNLGALTEDDARDEGYTSLAAFKRQWKREHGRWDASLPVWDLRFVVVGKPARMRQDNLLDRLGEEA